MTHLVSSVINTLRPNSAKDWLSLGITCASGYICGAPSLLAGAAAYGIFKTRPQYQVGASKLAHRIKMIPRNIAMGAMVGYLHLEWFSLIKRSLEPIDSLVDIRSNALCAKKTNWAQNRTLCRQYGFPNPILEKFWQVRTFFEKWEGGTIKDRNELIFDATYKGPFREEFYHRFLYPNILKGIGNLFSIKNAPTIARLATATFFALGHTDGLSGVVAKGLYAYLVLIPLSESFGLESAIAAHFINNAVAVGILPRF